MLEARFERVDAARARGLGGARRLRRDGASGWRPGRAACPIGIGVCELVDREGHTQSAQTLDWRAIDLAGAFARVGPAVVESDVRAAAVAEARFGGGRGVDELLLRDGRDRHLVLPGAATGAPTRARAATRSASGRRRSRTPRAASRWPPPAGARWAEEVLADPSLDGVVEAAAAALGAGLAWLVNALDPGTVVIGGGLGLVDRYRELAVAAMRPMIFADNTRDLPVVPAQLGADAGVIGAALAAVAPLGCRRSTTREAP